MRCPTPFQPDRGNPNISQWSLPNSKGLTARLGQGYVEALALSPDGAYLAVACDAGLWWYDAASVSPIALWTGEALNSHNAAFSPSGRQVATSGRNIVRIWDIESGNLDSSLTATHKGWICATAFSPDGRWFAAIKNDRGADAGHLDIWHAETGEKIPPLKEKGVDHWSGPLTFSSDGRLMACCTDIGHDQKSVTVWELETGAIAAHLEGAKARDLCFSPCGQYLAAGDWAFVQVWDVNAGQLAQSYAGYGERLMHVSYTPEGVLRAAGQPQPSDHGSLRIWDVEREQIVFADEPRAGWTGNRGAVFLDGSTLAYLGNLEWRIWKSGENKQRVGQHTHLSCPESLRFLQDGKTLASVGFWDGALLWDVQSADRPPRRISPEGEGCFSMDAAPDGKLFLASFSESDHAVRLREIDGGAKPPVEYKGPIFADVCKTSISMAAGLVCHNAKDGSASLWDARTGMPIRILDLYCQPSLSPDGNYLAGEPKGGWNIWDHQTRECMLDADDKRIEGRNLAISPDGRLIAGYEHSEEAVVLWDIERREARLRIALPEEWDHRGDDCYYAFSPCGRYLGCTTDEVGTEETAVQIWSVDTGERLAVYAYPGADCLAFSPDGSMLAVANFGGTIRLWDIAHLGNQAP